jgi:hypothetical protein
MACLSPSPSGRRLSELLEEKQEPFLLDIHLLEKGCPSSRLLDGYDAATCWPAPGTIAVLKRLTNKKNKAAAASSPRGGKKKPAGILKLVLSQILQSTAACSRWPPVLQYCDSFKTAAVVAPAPSCHSDPSSCSGSESSYSSSDDDEEQLSPVSVLDHPFESSPVHAKLSPASGKLSLSGTAATDVFRELLNAAYSPALLTHLLANAKSDDLGTRDTAAVAAYEDDEDEYGYRTSPKNDGRYDDAAYWEAELARVSALVATEVPNALRLDSAAVRPEREDVGVGIADAVLQALLQELAVDLGSC